MIREMKNVFFHSLKFVGMLLGVKKISDKFSGMIRSNFGNLVYKINPETSTVVETLSNFISKFEF